MLVCFDNIIKNFDEHFGLVVIALAIVKAGGAKFDSVRAEYHTCLFWVLVFENVPWHPRCREILVESYMCGSVNARDFLSTFSNISLSKQTLFVVTDVKKK